MEAKKFVCLCHVPPSLHPIALGYTVVQFDSLFDETCANDNLTALIEPANLVDFRICRHVDGIIRSIKRWAAWSWWWIQDWWWPGPTCHTDDR